MERGSGQRSLGNEMLLPGALAGATRRKCVLAKPVSELAVLGRRGGHGDRRAVLGRWMCPASPGQPARCWSPAAGGLRLRQLLVPSSRRGQLGLLVVCPDRGIAVQRVSTHCSLRL